MLTIEKLKKMEPGVFATGTGCYPELLVGGMPKKEIRWIAVRGGYHDWTIYYSFVEDNIAHIKDYGNKCFTDHVIKTLVPCDRSAFDIYRR